MPSERDTTVSYKAIASFSQLHRELRKTREELAKTQAAEKAYNATSAKDRASSTKASVTKSKALTQERNSLRDVIKLASRYATVTKGVTTNTKLATLAIQAQNRALKTNALNLSKAAVAAKEYAAAQKKISSSTGMSSDAIRAQKEFSKAQRDSADAVRNETRELRTNSIEKDKARKANVRFVEGVGDVNEATGEVIETAQKAERSTSRWADALQRARDVLKRYTTDALGNADTQKIIARAQERHSDAVENLRIAELRLSELRKKAGVTASTVAAAEQRVVNARRRVNDSAQAVEKTLRDLRREGKTLPTVFRRIDQSGTRLFSSLRRFGDWRPRLVPPFIALIPIIGAVVAAMNPLVALLGSVGAAAVGLAGQIGSLSGAFLALPGILSGVVAGIGSVIASMGGVGNVFKTYAAMQKAVNSGGSNAGRTQAERADQLADAERALAKAQKNVQKAQENLNKAREKALKDLIDLRIEVSRASMNEERAIANLRQAQEAYWNTMADPGSTLGDKLDAAVAIKEAEADLQDVRQKNIENQKELADAEKKGVENSEAVIDAQDRLTDAYEAQKDAQRNLTKVQKGESAASVKAVNAYNEALAKLSPSARKFVLALIAMQDQWKAFRSEMQEEFFSKFVGDIDKLPQLLRNLRSFLKPAAGAMGEFTSSFINLMASPQWSRDMKTIGEQNASVIKNLGDGVLALSNALRDIVIAAGPFTDWMTNGFARGSENFAAFVGKARETGELARWLDKVAERMQKWWTVVKNVGATIFNYSAAAESFGGWLLDGLVDITDGWKKASEEARKEGSPFQQYLENVKPLLSEVKSLFAEFFGWLSDEMMDPENIKDAQDLVKVIRDDLGPAVGRLLDALAKTDIDEKFVKALASIIESLAVIMENGGGKAFEIFFDVLESFFQMLADITEKIDPKVLEAILTFLGTLAAISFIGKFTGLQSLIGLLLGLNGKTSLFTQLNNFFKGFKGLDKLKFAGVFKFLGRLLKVAGVAGAIISVVTGIIDVGTTAYNGIDAANKGDYKGARDSITDLDNGLLSKQNPLTPGFGMNPIPIITGGASFIDSIFGTNFKQNLQDFVNDAFDGLADPVDNALNNITNGWKNFWDGLGSGEFASKAGEEFGNFLLDIKTNWDNFWKPIGEQWNSFWNDLNTGKLWENINREIRNFGIDFENNWNGFWGSIGTNWDNFWNDLKTGKLWDNIKKELSNFGADFRKNWDNFWNGLSNGFQTIVTGIGNVWRGIQNAFSGPANWVITHVWNNGIVSFWNGLASKLGWNQLKAAPLIGGSSSNPASGKAGGKNIYAFADGGVLPGYTPGRDVHDFVSPTGGRLSLSGGEAIMRPEFTKLVGGKKGVDALNKKAKNGEAFANGGVWSGGKSQHFAGGGVWEVAGDIWNKFAGFFANPMKYVTDGFMNAVGSLTGLGNSDYGKMLAQIPPKVAQGLGKLATDKAKTARRASDVVPDGNGMKWAAMWEIVKKQFPWARLNSAYYDRIGGKTYHAKGRAIDVTPSMEIFNWLKQNYPNSKELIYSPANGRQLQNGKEHFWGEPVRSAHFNHVHWAMKNGGVIPGLYDNGGWLPHGGMAVNQSGKPEAVLDPTESRALKALLSGSGLGARPAFGASAATAVSSVPQINNDYSINIDNLTIQNPVPEKVSDSLPKAIRRVGYMNEARSR